MGSSWQEDYDRVSKNPPPEGTVIKAIGGGKTKVVIELIDGKEPFMYSLMYVPTLVGTPAGWYARAIDDKSMFGWKAILLPKARNEIIKRHGLSKTAVPIDGLRIIRKSQEGKSLLVELYTEPVKQVQPLFKKAEVPVAIEEVKTDIPY